MCEMGGTLNNINAVGIQISKQVPGIEASQNALNQAGIQGFWIYRHDPEGFIVDKACANLVGLDENKTFYTIDDLFPLHHPEFWADFMRCIKSREKGDLILLDATPKEGPNKDLPLSAIGSVIVRNDKDIGLYACGYLTRNSFSGDLFSHNIGSSGTWDWDGVTGAVRFSASYVSMLGYKDSADIATTVEQWAEEIVHPEDRASTAYEQFQILASPDKGDYFECCIRLKRKDGQYLWTLGRGLVTARDQDGRAIRLVGTNTDLSLVQHNFDDVREKLFTDTLTGLYNREYLQAHINEFEKDGRKPLSVIFADITGLKAINDNLGHSSGDILLKSASYALLTAVQKEHEVIRLSGDEFLILLPRCSDVQCSMIVRSLQVILQQRLTRDPHSIPLLIGFGQATVDEVENDSLSAAIKRADERMQKVKDENYEANYQILKQWLENNLGKEVEFSDKRRVTLD